MISTAVSGSDILDQRPEDLAERHGMHIIHQSWKTTHIPKAHASHFKSWPKHHPNALHVLWTDVDNDALIKKFYPHYADVYSRMKLPIQKCDFVRLLYLHRYGGCYADLDYEAHANLFTNLPDEENEIYLVESPVLLNEVHQNSLMISRTQKHPFWVNVT